MPSSRLPLTPSSRLTRRALGLCAVGAVATLAFGAANAAGAWPSRPIMMTVGSPAGSLPDTVARDLVARIGMALGQPIVVENVPGAGGVVGMDRVRQAAPDGHRFIFTNIGAVVISPALQKSFPYDPVRDFDAVSLISTGPMVLVASTSLGVETLAQLLELARRKPMMYGSVGIGTPPHIFVEQLKAATRLPLDHVPFKGSNGLAQALLGDHVSVGMEALTVLLPLIEGGKVRPLAVSGEKRLALLPQVPTFSELGVPSIGVAWLAVMAPKGTLPEAVTAMNRELTRVLAQPDLRTAWAAIGRHVGGGPPEVLEDRIRTELPRWKSIIDSAGIRPE